MSSSREDVPGRWAPSHRPGASRPTPNGGKSGIVYLGAPSAGASYHACRSRGAMSRLKIVYCGLAGAFSGPPLTALLAVGHDVRAVVMPTLAGRLDGGTLAYR